jgi:hypothetical protein
LEFLGIKYFIEKQLKQGCRKLDRAGKTTNNKFDMNIITKKNEKDSLVYIVYFYFRNEFFPRPHFTQKRHTT